MATVTNLSSTSGNTFYWDMDNTYSSGTTIEPYIVPNPYHDTMKVTYKYKAQADWVDGWKDTLLDSLGIDDDDGGELALLDERVEEVCQMGRL